MTDRDRLIALALKCGAFANDGSRGIPAGQLITFEPEELESFAAALSAEQPAGEAIYLVATGLTICGEETYTRHEGRPPPLCDSEGPLYASPIGSPKGGDGLTDDTRMWAVHIQGPDDIHAASDRAIADAVALVLNRQFERHPLAAEVPMLAVVVEWPYGYESWSAAKDLLRLDVVEMAASRTADKGER